MAGPTTIAMLLATATNGPFDGQTPDDMVGLGYDSERIDCRVEGQRITVEIEASHGDQMRIITSSLDHYMLGAPPPGIEFSQGPLVTLVRDGGRVEIDGASQRGYVRRWNGESRTTYYAAEPIFERPARYQIVIGDGIDLNGSGTGYTCTFIWPEGADPYRNLTVPPRPTAPAPSRESDESN